ncbi:hypothetical protein R9X49_13060 [Pectobacterium carotovorum]|uniref:hypothetical protein n=1 Tax=Pectobacterium carotovorum TaxID=554 RepID=UPI0029DC68FB|nr:hypothetical protein [Pectobacterium carotovorum]MDX6916037.1 hypothetical protein [Pectobacterium carotovorum]
MTLSSVFDSSLSRISTGVSLFVVLRVDSRRGDEIIFSTICGNIGIRIDND